MIHFGWSNRWYLEERSAEKYTYRARKVVSKKLEREMVIMGCNFILAAALNASRLYLKQW